MGTQIQSTSGDVHRSTSTEGIRELRDCIAKVPHSGAEFLLVNNGESGPGEQARRRAISSSSPKTRRKGSRLKQPCPAASDLAAYRVECENAAVILKRIPKGLFDDAAKPLIERWSTKLLVLFDELAELASTLLAAEEQKATGRIREVGLSPSGAAAWQAKLAQLRCFDRELKIVLEIASDEIAGKNTSSDATENDTSCDTPKRSPKKNRRPSPSLSLCADAFLDAVTEEPSLTKTQFIRRWADLNDRSPSSLLRQSNDYPQLFRPATNMRQA